ncbi:hypothetical protein [Sphingobium indicum]
MSISRTAKMAEGDVASLMSPVGPVSDQFVYDQRFITAIMGPYGSAKTTSCIRKIVNSVFWQEPGPDGVRRVRWCVVRDTYGQLETNVMNSWFTWFPKTKNNWNGNEMCHRLRFEGVSLDGSPPSKVEIEMYFRAMGDRKAEDVLKGLELTGLWLNETDTLDKTVLLFGMPRTGRYPSAKNGGCQWRGIICDFNAPDVDNWTYQLLVQRDMGLTPEQEAEYRRALGPRFGIGFHRQPGGLSKDPVPENIQNLPDGYYETLMLGFGHNENHVRRFIHNEFGAVWNGQPVYPEFNREIHVADDVRPDPSIPIDAGLDGGRTPAMVFGQKMPNGQRRVLDELVVFNPDPDKKEQQLERLGPTAMAEIARDFVAQAYPHCQMGTVYYDPAIDFGGDDDGYDWLKFFRATFKAPRFKPGGKAGNRIEPRLESVRKLLAALWGGKPAMSISSRCKSIIRGMAGGYIFERVKLSNGTGRFRDRPIKNDFSHGQDALQSLCLGWEGEGEVVHDMERRHSMRRASSKVKHTGFAGARR